MTTFNQDISKSFFFKKTEEKKDEIIIKPESQESSELELKKEEKFKLTSLCCDIDRSSCLYLKSNKKKK